MLENRAGPGFAFAVRGAASLIAVASVLFLSLAVPLQVEAAEASDLYVLPQATGDGSGRDWANARGAMGGGLQDAWHAAGGGGTVYVGSGTYENVSLQIGEGGFDADRPKSLVGADTGGGLPRFLSDFDKLDPANTGSTLVTAHTGAANFSLENLHIDGYRYGVHLRGGNNNVRLAGLDIERSRDAIIVHGGASASTPDLRTTGVVIQDTNIRHYTKRGVRIRDGVSDMLVSNVHVDAGGADWATERFAMGFHMHGDIPGVYNENITFVDSSASNHWDPQGADDYWNADGFAAERQNRGLTYIRSAAYNNTDGGWDDKSESPVLIDTVSIGNKRNYRFWSEVGPATLTNSLSAYALSHGGTGAANGLWVAAGAHVIAEQYTHLGAEGYALEVHGTNDTAALVEFINSILTMPDATELYQLLQPEAQVVLDQVVEHYLLNPDVDPMLVGPALDANTRSDAFNSLRYPELGYYWVPEPASATAMAALMTAGLLMRTRRRSSIAGSANN